MIIFLLGQPFDGFIIGGILLFNSILGTIHEGRAQNILASLKKYIKAEALAIRAGHHIVIPATQLVPGDIILLKEGEKIPADARIIQEADLKIDEALLTGESTAVAKQVQVIEKITPLAEQHNMVFSGTYVLAGSATCIVTAIGTATEFGKIGHAIATIEEELPLKKQLDQLSGWILVAVGIQTALLFFIGILLSRPIKELIIFLSALFICVIPEGLPVALTLALVVGARNLAKKQVLVNRLQAVEGLGLANVIVIDKTGTLTYNELVVQKVYSDHTFYEVSGYGYKPEGKLYTNNTIVDPAQKPDIMQIAIAGILLNKAEITFDKKTQTYSVIGDPTDAALYVFGQKIGLQSSNIIAAYTTRYEIPFDAKLRMKIGFYQHKNQIIIFAIGAPEQILQRCRADSKTDTALAALLKQGYRVLAIATKKIDTINNNASHDYYLSLLQDMHLLGLVGIQDAIREDVGTIVQQTREAGIHIVMATGDHKETALFVARTVAIYQPGDLILQGQELATMSDQQLLATLPKTTVIARMSAEQKLRIVQLYKQLHNIVAMTGDGVNDVPPIVAADLGIAMGKIGTDVAKAAADLVLLDDYFASIIAAIKEGRHIFFTLRHVILYFLTTNFSEIILVFLSLLFNTPLPLYPTQILWLNFVTDGFLDISLVAEPQQPDILFETLPSKHLVDVTMLKKMISAIPMAIGSMIVFLVYADDLPLARTLTLMTMAFFQWFNVWNCRSETKSMFQLGLFTNKWLIAATIFVLFLQIAVIYIPLLQIIFRTMPISFSQWLLAAGLGSTIVLFEEISKYYQRPNMANRKTKHDV